MEDKFLLATAISLLWGGVTVIIGPAVFNDYRFGGWSLRDSVMVGLDVALLIASIVALVRYRLSRDGTYDDEEP